MLYYNERLRGLGVRGLRGEIRRGDDSLSTLQELIRYCGEEERLGALLLTGEWGCGKTHLIEKDLAEALRSTHDIVRVSLFSVDSVTALSGAVKRQWIRTCTPLLGRLDRKNERVRKNGLFHAISTLLMYSNTVGGSVASAIASVDPVEYISLDTLIDEYYKRGEQKRIVLVFDDLSRSRLDLNQLVGAINEYCENRRFATIVIAQDAFIKSVLAEDPGLYKMIREKTISRSVRYMPDYRAIIHSIITGGKWPGAEYAAFLKENEQVVYDALVSDSAERQGTLGKYHNLRSMSCALRDFARLYDLMAEREPPYIAQYLYTFIAYTLVSRNGVSKNGQPSFEVEDAEMKQLYPQYSTELMPESIRQWAEFGVWEEDEIVRDISDHEKRTHAADAAPGRP